MKDQYLIESISGTEVYIEDGKLILKIDGSTWQFDDDELVKIRDFIDRYLINR